jgi:hypothetical protein
MKISFKRSPAGYSYTAPYEYDVPDKLAKKFIAEGVASASTPVLPTKFPAREKLIEAGFQTIDEITEGLEEIKEIVSPEEFEKISKALK